MKKSIFLVLTLAIPVSIFLFLKFFGKNSFDIPILFENGIPDCFSSSSPHRVPNFEDIGETKKNLVPEKLKGFLIFGVLDGTETNINKSKLTELIRIQDAFYEVESPFFVLFLQGYPEKKYEIRQLCIELGLEEQNFTIAMAPQEQLMDFLKCGIALVDNTSKDFDNLVLVDPAKNIRGIYQSLDLEQTDQLILELKILKQKV